MSQYYDKNPQTASDRRTFQVEFEGRKFQFITDSGVFSKGALDIGSAVFLKSLITDLRADPANGRLLDVGCGYGPLGIVIKRIFPAFELTMVDVNERALSLARENLSANAVGYARVLTSDGLSALEGETFDVILTNPPIRAGKETVYRIFDESREHLVPGGRFYAVIGKKQGAPSAMRKLEELFGNCERIGREAGFWILRCDVDGE